MNRRQTGSIYETKAAEYLIRQGVCILERNYRIRSGEIDLIGRDGEYLVFFEVKYRNSGKMGRPLQAVDYRKQKKIVSVARYYLYVNHCPYGTPVRFDCVGITEDGIDWIRNAFHA